MKKHILLNLSLIFLLGVAYAQGPALQGLSPRNNASSVSTQPQLQLSFDINIQKGTGAVVVKDLSDDAMVETIDVSSAQVSIANATATIILTESLTAGSAYYILVEEGTFENPAGEPFAGIVDNAAWSFTTVCGSGPTNLGGGTTNNSATLDWDEVEGAVDYQLWIEGEGVISSTGGNNYYFLNNLPSGYTFNWTVKYQCPSTEYIVYSDSSFSQFRTKGTNACANAPTGLSATVTKESATLTWTAVAGVTYEVLVEGLGIVADNVVGNTYTITDLTPLTTYSFSVRAICAEYSKSDWSAPYSFTTATCAEVPTGLTATNIDDHSVILSWDNMGAEDYQLWVSGIGNIYSTEGNNSYTLENLGAGSTYTWKVKSKCKVNGRTVVSGNNASGEFTTSGENICAQAPQNLIVSNIESNTVTLSWDDMGASDYQLWVSGIGNIFTTNGENSYVLEGLGAGSTYTWQVKSKCQWTGRTIFSNSVIGEFATSGESNCAQAPQNLTVSNIEPNSVTLSWDDMGASDYQLWVSGIGNIFTTNGENSYVLEGLGAGSTYTWQVKSKCQWTGRTIFSNSVTGEFATSGESNCAQAPQNLTVSNIEPNSITLSWDDMGASDYQLWVSGIGNIFTTNGENSYVLEGLEAGTTYAWAVKSKCQWTGRTVFSPLAYGISFTTPEPILIEEVPFTEQPIAQEEVLIEEKSEVNVSMYPNPSVDEIRISVEGDNVINAIVIYNTQGQVVKEIYGLNSTSETVSLREAGSGLYLVHVLLNGEVKIIQRVIIVQ